MRAAAGCCCGKHMCIDTDPLFCIWCGRGECAMPVRRSSDRLRRLPWDLGALQREGRRPDPHLDNVVRLDRLRDRWKVPALAEFVAEDPLAEADVELTGQHRRVLALLSSGLTRDQVANALGVERGTLSAHLSEIYARLGIRAERGPNAGGALEAAIAWWQSIHEGRLAA